MNRNPEHWWRELYD